MSKALYRKYRSKTLDEVIGQKHITDILTRAIKKGSISHAYLLTGPRGVGKTSVARIMAYEINNLAYDEETLNLDIIEIDAASNNGVEDVRDLREKVQIAPVSAKKKVYIIDEVHMLSKAAFNALLKTLEEPPEHIVFILATTNVEKLPATIISRTQRFAFRPISIDDVSNHLAYIAKSENIIINDDAVRLIAQHGDGSFRDSISLLDQLSNLVDEKDTITVELIENSLGLAPTNTVTKLIEAVDKKDLKSVISILDQLNENGVNITVLVEQLSGLVRQQIVEKPELIKLLDALIDVPKSSQPELKLLSVLGIAATPKPTVRTVALATPVLEVSASIAELEKKAVEPIENIEKTITPEPKKSEIIETTVVEAVTEAVKPKKAKKTDAGDFDATKLIEYTRQNYVAIYSVLSKCGFQIDGADLYIYTTNNFYKKKLDDVKYSPLLYKSLEEIGFSGLDIHTIPTTLPPSDIQAAAIAAIMGGGEEVSLEPA